MAVAEMQANRLDDLVSRFIERQGKVRVFTGSAEYCGWIIHSEGGWIEMELSLGGEAAGEAFVRLSAITAIREVSPRRAA
jgi:hypothetical protein